MGKARTIQVEVRKKRVFVKRDEQETAPPVEEAAPAPVAAAPLITAEELAARAAEEKKGQELIARQQEEIQQKQAQAAKRKTKKEKEAEEAAAKAAADAAAAEAAKAAEAPPAKAPAPAPTAKAKAPGEGTLHRPATKPGEKARTVKKSGTAFQEEAARRRALKLRGDVTGGAATTGWRQPKVGGPRRHDEEGGEAGASAASGPIVREIAVPETISSSPISRTRCRSRPPSSSRR